MFNLKQFTKPYHWGIIIILFLSVIVAPGAIADYTEAAEPTDAGKAINWDNIALLIFSFVAGLGAPTVGHVILFVLELSTELL